MSYVHSRFPRVTIPDFYGGKKKKKDRDQEKEKAEWKVYTYMHIVGKGESWRMIWSMNNAFVRRTAAGGSSGGGSSN